MYEFIYSYHDIRFTTWCCNISSFSKDTSRSKRSNNSTILPYEYHCSVAILILSENALASLCARVSMYSTIEHLEVQIAPVIQL